MFYEKIDIIGLPKSYDLWESLDLVNPCTENPGDILYDGYPGELYTDDDDSMDAFKYKESATSINLVWHGQAQVLKIQLSKWAVKSDVEFLALYVNALLNKYKRAKAVIGDKVLKAIPVEDVAKAIEDRTKYLKKKIKEGKSFEMVGLRVTYLIDADDAVLDVESLQRDFVNVQWEDCPE